MKVAMCGVTFVHSSSGGFGWWDGLPPSWYPMVGMVGMGRDVGDMGGLGVTDGGYNALKLESAVLLTVSSI